jgi:anaerobic ribonucleoside-triphosphate reductase activating protein
MVFTGFVLENLRAAGRPDYDALLAETDLLIDGPYVQERFVSDRRWIGSANQRARFLTERYGHLADGRDGWPGAAPGAPGQRNTVELRLSGGKLSINGFPDADVLALIRRLEALQAKK